MSDFLNSSSLGYVYDNAGNCSRATQPKPLHRVEIPLPYIATANQNAQSTLSWSSRELRRPHEPKTTVEIALSRDKVLNLLAHDRRIHLVLRGVSAKRPPGALFAVYKAPAARPTVRQLAGTISWFGVFGHHGSREPEVRNLVFDVTEHLQQMGDLSKEADFVVTLEADSGLVPSGPEHRAALSAPPTVFKPEAEVRIAAIELQQVAAASRRVN